MGKSKTTRQEIMRVTKELILQKGYAQVTMNDITQASGMSAGGLYYHYRTVAEIVEEILKSETGRGWDTIGRPANVKQLTEAVRAYFESEKSELLDYRNSLNWVMYEYIFSFPREQREAMLKEKHSSTAAMIKDILSPFIRSEEKADMLAKSICVEMLGLAMFSMTDLMDEKLIEMRFDSLIAEIEKEISEEGEVE